MKLVFLILFILQLTFVKSQKPGPQNFELVKTGGLHSEHNTANPLNSADCFTCTSNILEQISNDQQIAWLRIPVITETKKKLLKNRITLAAQCGISASYNDRALNKSISASFVFDYNFSKSYSVQLAPKYTWLYKWNEHYLTLPIHVKRNLGTKFSMYAGPALTLDVGYFSGLGLSAGILYQLNKKHAIVLSAFTFDLYKYHIDYFYVPVEISYRVNIYN